MLPLHHDYNLHSFVSVICSHAQFIGSLIYHWLSYLWLTFPHLHLCFTTPNLLKTFWNKNRVQGVVILIWYSQRLEWWRKEILKLDKQDCISPITCLSPAYFIVSNCTLAYTSSIPVAYFLLTLLLHCLRVLCLISTHWLLLTIKMLQNKVSVYFLHSCLFLALIQMALGPSHLKTRRF